MFIANTKSQVLSLVRRSDQTILWTYEGSGFGNVLYYWMRAHIEQRSGNRTRVLWTHKMHFWEKYFSEGFRDLVIRREDVSFFSPRRNSSWFQNFGLDFSADDLSAFIGEYVLRAGSQFSEQVERTASDDTLWINVRRGDYYSVPKFRGQYSFDISEYLKVALEKAMGQEPVRRIGIVSDDLEWCRLKLAWLEDVAPVGFAPPQANPMQQLALLAGARRLILGNSTFSYWAAYISNFRLNQLGDSDALSKVIAPAFHNRYSPRIAEQLNPSWDIVESIPGGWDG